MNIYHLSIELTLDIIVVIMGGVLIIKPTDNFPKFYWGIIAAAIGIMFTWENVGWIFIRSHNPTFEYMDILNIEKMLKWYALASFVSLFPLASLRPGYLSRLRLLIFLLPPIIITTIGICYLCFNGNITLINSIEQIAPNINQLDVKLRLLIFLFTVITPCFYFIYPMISAGTYRKINPMMYLFIGFMFLLFGIYISFTLFINDIFFNAFGIIAIIFSIFFSAQYLRFENPLSDYIDVNNNKDVKIASSTTISSLYYKIENYLKETCEYINSNYTIEDLAEYFGEKESVISAAIKSGGHTGFREYINYLRLEHFKYEASKDPHKTIKELMYACGFTSRSTFYRVFSEQYNITPTKYIENQAR